MQGKIGPKSRNLEFLESNGFQIPPFLTISCSQVVQINNNIFDWDTFLERIKDSYPSTSYAIRSSALSEDCERSSEAGKYKTLLDIQISDIKDSTIQIIEDYKKIQNSTDVSGFSVIIQRFILPEVSGVTFTRSPEHDRNMYIEYVFARWDSLVGGQNIPKIWRAYHHWKIDFSLENWEKYIQTWWKIEELFDLPMDIEWCISKWELYILQARSITTISQKEFESYEFLDSELFWKQDFLYSTGMTTEMTPSPTPFTMSLLKRINSIWWWVEKFYKKNHIQYRDPDCFYTFGNQLYVEKNKEKSQFQWWTWWQSLKNRIFLFFLKPEKKENLEKEIRRINNQDIDHFSLSEALSSFLEDYSIVYSINFSAGFYQNIAKKLNLDPIIKSLQIKDEWFIGNSLEIADESHWKTFIEWDDKARDTWVYRELSRKISEYLTFREIWRSIIVRYVSAMRKLLIKIAQERQITNYRDLYFLTIEEILEDNLDKKSIQIRKDEYEKNISYIFPSVISSDFQNIANKEITWASWDHLEWILVSLDTLANFPKPVILYTRFLSPNIVEYFDQIDGIISENWWALSHLALVARERWIPVMIDEKVLEKYRIGNILTIKK